MLSEFSKKVYKKLRIVPRGKITTYGELAKAIGKEGAARAVGNALNKNPFSPTVPCHRVVKSDGSIGGFAEGVKRKVLLLEKEGVKIKKGRINNFKNILYKF